MPIPLVTVLSALAAGGSLVPHAAGGMIVTSASGYVAGTFLSTSAIATLVNGAAATAGAGLALAFNSMRGMIGATLARTAAPSVVAGTTIGSGTAVSSAIVGFLTGPIGLSLTTGGVAVGIGYCAYRLYNLNQKVSSTADGEEAHFTEAEAKIIEKLIKRSASK